MWLLAKVMYCFRRVGREPGRLASSTRSWALSSLERREVGETGLSGGAEWEGSVVVEKTSAEGAEGWEMAFWPVITVPSSKPADMWCEKLELIAGITFTFAGTPVIAPNRYMLLSKLPVKSLAPVRNKFPTDADWKLNTDEGRARFTISRLMVLRKERMSSRFEEDICIQREWRASTMSSHSMRAREGEEVRRWLKNVLMAAFSRSFPAGSSGMRRTRRPGGIREEFTADGEETLNALGSFLNPRYGRVENLLLIECPQLVEI